jgi:hypothetical protein
MESMLIIHNLGPVVTNGDGGKWPALLLYA